MLYFIPELGIGKTAKLFLEYSVYNGFEYWHAY